MQAQLQPLMYGKKIQLRRHRGARVEKREHIGNTQIAMARQFGETADRDPDREVCRHQRCNVIGATKFLPLPPELPFTTRRLRGSASIRLSDMFAIRGGCHVQIHAKRIPIS